MFLLNGNPLPLDTAFTAEDGRQFPANWLRLSSPEERAEVGITEVPDPVRPDDRFYWVDGMNNGIPKDLDQLKADWTKQVDQIAYTLLLPTDWMIVRKAEIGTEIPAATTTYRAAVRSSVAAHRTAITNAVNIEDFISVVTSLNWPEQV
jgi:hypothetical protein